MYLYVDRVPHSNNVTPHAPVRTPRHASRLVLWAARAPEPEPGPVMHPAEPPFRGWTAARARSLLLGGGLHRGDGRLGRLD